MRGHRKYTLPGMCRENHLYRRRGLRQMRESPDRSYAGSVRGLREKSACICAEQGGLCL